MGKIPSNNAFKLAADSADELETFDELEEGHGAAVFRSGSADKSRSPKTKASPMPVVPPVTKAGSNFIA